MKIAVICANGKAGKLIVKEAVNRGAVIDAFGAWTEDTLSLHSTSLKHLCDILSGTDTRLLVVGGAGSLYVNPEHTACVADGPDFPDGFKPLAGAMAKALSELRQRRDVRWTYISPAGDFQAEGERTGKYILGGEELTGCKRKQHPETYQRGKRIIGKEIGADRLTVLRRGSRKERLIHGETCYTGAAGGFPDPLAAE